MLRLFPIAAEKQPLSSFMRKRSFTYPPRNSWALCPEAPPAETSIRTQALSAGHLELTHEGKSFHISKQLPVSLRSLATLAIAHTAILRLKISNNHELLNPRTYHDQFLGLRTEEWVSDVYKCMLEAMTASVGMVEAMTNHRVTPQETTQCISTSTMGPAHEQPDTTANVATPTDHTSYSAASIHEYVTGVAQGDAPITTMLQQGGTDSNLAARQAKVQGEVSDAIEKYGQAA
ncbi:hypothetical protein F4821DRAFT_262084 [Hypoxylon rubiginosum]|uniref:Uncharacterized protein n=1 Tax=Hypoxylon rubiginosum TaxID=110542 RepID=A0ACC0CUX6_9PEZI|nr:hypothetical protein F4821DRAFT_262084 [Hypoxylon rubiginosum]